MERISNSGNKLTPTVTTVTVAIQPPPVLPDEQINPINTQSTTTGYVFISFH